jgi:hypothetical protein
MVVKANLTPAITVTASPGVSLCAGSTATFNAAAVNGGSAPEYTWLIDGTPVTGVSDATYSYQPEDNDVVTVKLNSSYECVAVNDVLSAGVTMDVATVFVPVVSVSANTGTSAPKGTEVTFTATVTNAGATPTYQWLINSKEINGAVQSTFKTSSLKNGDSVTCQVQGTGECSKSSINSVVMEITDITGVTTGVIGNSEIRLSPNPNNGGFRISGTLSTTIDESVTFEVTDMLGQVVYRGNATARGGVLDTHIQLSNTLANGMYMLNMGVGAERKAFHFAVKQ